MSFLHSSGFLGDDFSLVAAAFSAVPSSVGCIVAFVHVPGIAVAIGEKMSRHSKCYRIHLKFILDVGLRYYTKDHKSKR